jgi:hypothetical protein
MTGFHVPEAAAQGTKVATVQGLVAGSTRSIVSVTNAAGTSVATTMFQVSGDDIQAGATPTVASDGSYSVTYREASADTRNTTFTIYPAAKGIVPAVFADSFTGTDGTTLLAHDSRWAAAGALSNAAFTLSSNRLQIATPTGTIVTDAGTMNKYITFDVLTSVMAGFELNPSWSDSFNNIRVFFGNPSASLAPSVKANVKAFPANTSVVLNTGPAALINCTSMTVHVRIVNNKMSIYVGLVGGSLILSASNIDVTAGNLSTLVGLSAVSGGPVFLGNFECGQIGTGIDFTRFGAATALSCAPRETPVVAYDLTALKAQVPVSVSWTGTAPTALEIRVVDSATGTAITGYDWADWTTCKIGTGGAGGHTLVPKYNNYCIEVRDKNNTSMLARLARQSAGIVALFCKSQSNVANMVSSAGATNAYSGQGITWFIDPLTAFGGSAIGSPKDTDTNAMSNFVAPIVAGGGGAVMAVMLSSSGKRSDYFIPSGGYFQSMLPTVHRHVKRFNVLATQQGETDCDQAISLGWAIDDPATGWMANSKATIDGYFAVCNQNRDSVPVLVGLTSFENSNSVATLQGTIGAVSYLKMRKRERDLAALYGQGRLAMHMFDRTTSAGAGVHAIAADYVSKAAPRWGWSAAKALGLAANDRMGPKVTGVSRSGRVLTVTLDLNGATGLTDNLAGSVNGNNLYDGWQAVLAGAVSSPETTDGSFNTPALTPPLAWDTGTLPTYSSSGGTGTLTLTLLSDPGAAVALRYMASTSGTSPAVFDGASPFIGNYQSGASVYNPYKQVQGTYADVGAVGLAPMVDALVAA